MILDTFSHIKLYFFRLKNLSVKHDKSMFSKIKDYALKKATKNDATHNPPLAVVSLGTSVPGRHTR